MNAIHIIGVPPGEAPEHIRRAWVGLTLPLSLPGRYSTMGMGVLSGRTPLGTLLAVLSGRYRKSVGYVVESAVAIAMLDQSAPEAARWWRENTPHLLRPKQRFIFSAEVCEEVTATVWPPPPAQQGEAGPSECPPG